MSFLSYAQNFEDVMLWRALGHIPAGLYVDIGAQHPLIDSVSRSFYEHGWRGVHVEPVPEFAELLRADRLDETVLQIALGQTEGTLELNVIPDTGLSTAVEAYATRHQEERGYATRQIQVPVLTMRSALQFLAGRDVHWLKIDVEGFELQVLQGWDSAALRPWVMVVEATIPNSPETDFASWDPILVAARYRFVYFDGLNRFYVAEEHPELVAAFAQPPNVFDAVELSGLASWGLCRPVIEQRDAQLATQAATGAAALAERDARLGQLEADLAAARQQADGAAQEARAHIDALQANMRQHETDSLQWQRVAAGQQRDLVALSAERDALQARVATLDADNAALRTQAHARVHDQAGVQHLQDQHDNLAFEYRSALARIDELAHQAQRWWITAMETDGQLKAVLASRSWRLTAPLRDALKDARHSPALPARTLRWAVRRLRAMRSAPASHSTIAATPLPTGGAHGAAPPALSARETTVYRDLQQALEKSNP